jgi:hypothetical protein
MSSLLPISLAIRVEDSGANTLDLWYLYPNTSESTTASIV